MIAHKQNSSTWQILAGTIGHILLIVDTGSPANTTKCQIFLSLTYYGLYPCYTFILSSMKFRTQKLQNRPLYVCQFSNLLSTIQNNRTSLLALQIAREIKTVIVSFELCSIPQWISQIKSLQNSTSFLLLYCGNQIRETNTPYLTSLQEYGMTTHFPFLATIKWHSGWVISALASHQEGVCEISPCLHRVPPGALVSAIPPKHEGQVAEYLTQFFYSCMMINKALNFYNGNTL